MVKLIIEADLSSEELQVLISEVTILHRDVFKKPLVLQQTDVSGSLPCTHTFKTTYIGVGYVAQCTKCGFVRQ